MTSVESPIGTGHAAGSWVLNDGRAGAVPAR